MRAKILGNFLAQQTHVRNLVNVAVLIGNFLTHQPVPLTCSQQQQQQQQQTMLGICSMTPKVLGTFLYNKHMLGIWSIWLHILGTFSHINLFLWPAHDNNNNNNSDNNDNKHTSGIWSMRAKVLGIFLHKKTHVRNLVNVVHILETFLHNKHMLGNWSMPHVLRTFSHINLFLWPACNNNNNNNNNKHTSEICSLRPKALGTFFSTKHTLEIWSMWLHILEFFCTTITC